MSRHVFCKLRAVQRGKYCDNKLHRVYTTGKRMNVLQVIFFLSFESGLATPLKSTETLEPVPIRIH